MQLCRCQIFPRNNKLFERAALRHIAVNKLLQRLNILFANTLFLACESFLIAGEFRPQYEQHLLHSVQFLA